MRDAMSSSGSVASRTSQRSGSAFARAVQPFLVWDALKMLFAALTVTGIFTLAKKRA